MGSVHQEVSANAHEEKENERRVAEQEKQRLLEHTEELLEQQTSHLPEHLVPGDERPPPHILELVARPEPAGDALRDPEEGPFYQGSIIIGTEGVIHLPHIAAPRLFPAGKFQDYALPEAEDGHHWSEWAEACRTGATPSASFDYSGPLTESVLLGTVAALRP